MTFPVGPKIKMSLPELVSAGKLLIPMPLKAVSKGAEAVLDSTRYSPGKSSLFGKF